MHTNSCTCFMCNQMYFFDDDMNIGNEIEKNERPDRNSLWSKHICKPTKYVGFTDTFYYCKDCNKKLDFKEEFDDNEEDEFERY